MRQTLHFLEKRARLALERANEHGLFLLRTDERFSSSSLSVLTVDICCGISVGQKEGTKITTAAG